MVNPLTRGDCHYKAVLIVRTGGEGDCKPCRIGFPPISPMPHVFQRKKPSRAGGGVQISSRSPCRPAHAPVPHSSSSFEVVDQYTATVTIALTGTRVGPRDSCIA